MRPAVPQLRGGRAYVGEVAATTLAERFGTPLYVVDAAVIEDRMAALRDAVAHPRTHLHYSVKANPSVVVLRLLRGLGARLDACSPGDLAFAAAAGFDPAEISYVGCSMSDLELARVGESGVGFTADSLSQLERFGGLGQARAIGLRVNPGIEAGFDRAVMAGARTAKFGIHPSQVEEAVALARRLGLAVTGLHAHLGSGIESHEAHLLLLDRLLALGEQAPDLEWVNLGGGWGSPTYDLAAFGEGVGARLRTAGERLARPLTLRLEPGGHLVMDAGCLLTRVTEVASGVEVDGNSAPARVGVDTSFNHLPSAVLYGTRHPICIAERADREGDGSYDVVGNLMQAADVIASGRRLPAPCPHDLLVIGRCGGYAAWRSTNFNERPRPAEVLVDGTRATLTRRAETESDLIRLEAI